MCSSTELKNTTGRELWWYFVMHLVLSRPAVVGADGQTVRAALPERAIGPFSIVRLHSATQHKIQLLNAIGFVLPFRLEELPGWLVRIAHTGTGSRQA